MTQYNKKRHLELLKKRQEKSISSTESNELFNYSAMLDRQLDWETRDQYLQLLEEFMEEKISISEFCTEFEERGRLNGEVLDILESNLILLAPHEKSLDFLNFIEEILEYCEAYTGAPETLEEISQMSDIEFLNSVEKISIEFRNSIEKIYLRLQKFLEE